MSRGCRAGAAMLAGVMLAPSLTRAAGDAQEIVINGNRCQQSLDDLGNRETWCMVDGKPVRIEAPQREGESVATPTNYRADMRSLAASGHLSLQTADYLSTAALKYSWSGPLKWSAIFSTLAAGIAFGVDAEKFAAPGGIALGWAAISLVGAVALDASARTDMRRAAGIEEARRR